MQRALVEHSSSLDEVADFLNALVEKDCRIVRFQTTLDPDMNGAYHTLVLLESGDDFASLETEEKKPARSIIDVLRFWR